MPIDQLKPHPKNSNKHSDWQIKKIADSIKEFGFTQPVLISKDNVILAGHARCLGAKQAGLKEVPCRRFDHFTDEQARAYIIADNQLARLAEWDHKILASEIVELDKLEVDINVLGFDDKEMARIRDLVPDAGWDIEPVDNSKDDEIPDTQENIHNVTRGQIWQLGNHRLMCGDSTSKEDVDKLMGGEKADMVFTDPPYGIDFDPVNIGGKGQKSPKKIQGDNDTTIARKSWGLWDAEKKIWWGGNYLTDFLPVNGAWIVWNKMKFDKPDQPFSHCELAWTNLKGVAVKMYQHIWDGCFREGSKKDEAKSRVHPNQKPVGLISKLIDGEIISDPFLGSGSTLIACEKTNRKCYGMEIDPHYCSVIIERWQNYTGQTAQLIEP